MGSAFRGFPLEAVCLPTIDLRLFNHAINPILKDWYERKLSTVRKK
jgi:hypothetical protein